MTLDQACMVAAMRKAFGSEWFDRCGVDQAAKLLNRPLYPETHDSAMLSAMHCVKWSLMDEQTKQELYLCVMRHLGVELSHREWVRVRLDTIVSARIEAAKDQG